MVQSDNTVAQAKNTNVSLLLAFLVSRFQFVTTNLLFLMVGHTHEDVDQLFATVVALILRKHDFEEPEELMSFIHANLRGRFEQKSEELYIERLDTVRDFVAWLSPLGVTLYNAFMNRGGVEAPHSFSFKLRRDLLASERAWFTSRCPTSRSPNDDDVFCCVKTYMRDMDLQQEPVLAIPAGHSKLVKTAEPVGILPMHEMAPKTIEDLLLLASTCERELGLSRAASALTNLVLKRQYRLPPKGWLGQVGEPRPALGVDEGHPFFPHLPKSSWKLLAKQHHAR